MFKFIGEEKDLIELGFEAFVSELSGGAYRYSKSLDIKRKNEVDVELIIYTKTTKKRNKGDVVLYVSNDKVWKDALSWGNNDDGELVECNTIKEYNEACFYEIFNIDVLFDLCKKGLIKEVNDD